MASVSTAAVVTSQGSIECICLSGVMIVDRQRRSNIVAPHCARSVMSDLLSTAIIGMSAGYGSSVMSILAS
jgi:hypothetical protein